MKFVVLADRRTGTSLLLDTLNSHPDIDCVKRAFGLEKRIKNPTEDHHSGGYFLFRTKTIGHRVRHYTNRQESIDNFIEQDIFAQRAHLVAPGFRLLYGASKAYPEIGNWMLANEVKVIHLVRENLLKRLISEKTAPLHKMHHPRQGAEIKTVKIRLDPTETLEKLERKAKRVEAEEATFEVLKPLRVVYEEFSANRDTEAHRVLQFLGVSTSEPVGSDLVKINPDNIEALVENYDELCAALAGSQFERFL